MVCGTARENASILDLTDSDSAPGIEPYLITTGSRIEPLSNYYSIGNRILSNYNSTGNRTLSNYYSTGNRILSNYYSTGNRILSNYYSTGNRTLSNWYSFHSLVQYQSR